MSLETLKQLNWVDILVITLLIRTCYIGRKTGILLEIFKLLGTLTAVYMAMHYYTTFGNGLASHIASSPEKSVRDFAALTSFIILGLGGYLAVFFLRWGFCRLVKVETVSGLNKWGGLAIGMGRGLLTASLILFIFTISSLNYFSQSTAKSYVSSRLFSIAPLVYQGTWENFMAKFMPQEKLNPAVEEIIKEFKPK